MSLIQIEFEKKLIELGLSYRINNDDLYTITTQNSGGNHIKVLLILSLQPVIPVHGSKNGNDIQAIGLFKFKLPARGIDADLFIFAIPNSIKNQAEFLIIPTDELLRRLVRKNHSVVRRQRVEMVFWLMQDGFVYDTTSMSPEGEWYSMSKGVNGRLADGTDIDYSEFMNDWRRITVK